MVIFIKIELECVWPTVPIKNPAQVFFSIAVTNSNSTRIINVTHNKTENVSDANISPPSRVHSSRVMYTNLSNTLQSTHFFV